MSTGVWHIGITYASILKAGQGPKDEVREEEDVDSMKAEVESNGVNSKNDMRSEGSRYIT